MLRFKEKKHINKTPLTGTFLLVADIGGTNSTFALVQIKKEKPVLLVTFQGKSSSIKNSAHVVKQMVAHIKKEYGVKLLHACFAVAGVVSEKKDYGLLTNVPLYFDAHEIKKETGLQSVFIINDFEANGYAIDIVPKNSITVIKFRKNIPKRKNKALLGAGTGLGKSILIWNKNLKQHIPSASEGGHADFSVQNQQELKLVDFIKKIRNIPKKIPIEWEDVLSGSGLQNIYRYLDSIKHYKQTIYQKEIKRNTYEPYLISCYRMKDTQCHDTFELFTKFYARAAKNFALDSLALAGIYFTGGIAAGNPDIFKTNTFWNEFTNTRKQKKLLALIPIYVLTDTKIGLYGTAIYALFHKK